MDPVSAITKSGYSRIPQNHLDSTGKLLESAADEEHALETLAPSRNARSKTNLLVITAVRCVVILLALWGSIDIVRRASGDFHGSTIASPTFPVAGDAIPYISGPAHDIIGPDPKVYCKNECGRSIAEALAAGCEFDPMTIDYRRPECIDREMSKTFDAFGDWDYLTKVSSGEEPSLVNLSTLITLVEPGREVWVTDYWHIMFCVFKWRMQYRRVFTLLVDDNVQSEAERHHKHCTVLISDYVLGRRDELHVHHVRKPY